MPHKSNLQDTARAAMERHQWEDALRAWLDWWADRPEEASMDADALHDRAVCHFHCGDQDEAMQLLDSAVTHPARLQLPLRLARLVETGDGRHSWCH